MLGLAAVSIVAGYFVQRRLYAARALSLRTYAVFAGAGSLVLAAIFL